MPSRKRKRLKLKVAWVPTLWTLALANIAAGLWWSPVTAVTKYRVEGALPEDRATVERFLRGAKDEPLMRGKIQDVRVGLQTVLDRRVRVEAGPFGSGVVQIGPRDRGVELAVKGRTDVAVTGEGVVRVREEDERERMPVAVDARWLKAEPFLFEAMPVAALVQAGEIAKKNDRWGVSSIELRGDSVLSLVRADGRRIVFGPATELEAKESVLNAMLDRDAALLDRAKTLNLTAPEAPTVIWERR